MKSLTSNFAKLTLPFKHPLVLIGFAIMLLFPVYDFMLEQGLMSPLALDQGHAAGQSISASGFWLGLLLVILGIARQYYTLHAAAKETDLGIEQRPVTDSARISDIVQTLLPDHHQDLQARDEQIKALTEAVAAFSTGHGIDASRSELDAALDALAQGDTALARDLFIKAAQNPMLQVEETAQAYRNLGALVYFDNPEEALQAYRHATQLEPGNAESWNQLGHLSRRAGYLNDAIQAYNTVLALGEQQADQQVIACSYGNLGLVYQLLGDLYFATDFFIKALNLHAALGHMEGMANQYDNLGNVYLIRGDLNQAMEYYRSSLRLDEELGHNLGMAQDYHNLGVVYQAFGDLDQAIDYYQKALTLHEALGHKEGMAADCGKLGIVHQMRDDPDKALEYHHKALTLHEALGRKAAMAAGYGNLGVAYQTRGDLYKAMEFFQTALSLNEALGYKEGMGIQYGNLGSLNKQKGNHTEARRYYSLGLELFQQLGSPNAHIVQTWMNELT